MKLILRLLGTLSAIHRIHAWGYVLSRVKKPVQNPRTAPRTMANCSRAISDPLTSGGLISAI